LYTAASVRHALRISLSRTINKLNTVDYCIYTAGLHYLFTLTLFNFYL